MRGRYPFLTVANQVLGKRAGIFAESTIKERRRKYRYLNQVLSDLKEQGKVRTTNPRELRHEDIAAFMAWAREGAEALEDSTLVKYLQMIERLCEYAGNTVFDRMRAEGVQFPKPRAKELHPIDEDQLASMRNAVEARQGGWWKAVELALITLYPYTGGRPSELRFVDMSDLREGWILHIAHPKGLNKYAEPRDVPILPPSRPYLLRYLKARKAKMEKWGQDPKAGPLFPVFHNDELRYNSETNFRRHKARIEKICREAGVNPKHKWSLKTLRDSYCQNNLDRDPTKLNVISALMGHASTVTTQKYYGRIKNKKAIEDVLRMWEESSIGQHSHGPELDDMRKKPGIENRYEMTGYS